MSSAIPFPCIPGDRAPLLVIFVVMFTILATILVALRVYTRIRLVPGGLGWDDAFIVIAWVRRDLNNIGRKLLLSQSPGTLVPCSWFGYRAPAHRPGSTYRLSIPRTHHLQHQIRGNRGDTITPFLSILEVVDLSLPSTPIYSYSQLAVDTIHHNRP